MFNKNSPIGIFDSGLGGLTVFFIAGHVAAVLLDRNAHFRAVDVVVPYASAWRPTAIAAGVVALWFLIAVEGTALAPGVSAVPYVAGGSRTISSFPVCPRRSRSVSISTVPLTLTLTRFGDWAVTRSPAACVELALASRI